MTDGLGQGNGLTQDFTVTGVPIYLGWHGSHVNNNIAGQMKIATFD